MILFIVKSSISLLVIYILYKAFLSGENIPVFKRFYLLFALIFSIVISFISIKENSYVPDTISYVTTNYTMHEVGLFDLQQPLISDSGNLFSVKWLFLGIYYLVTVILFFRYIVNLVRLIKLSKQNGMNMSEGYKIVVLKQDMSPFSFFKTIFMSEKDYNNGAVRKELFIHELAHIRQVHSADILLIEFLQTICWFNPLLYFYKKEIKLNHEYLADKQVVDSGIDAFDYQKFILNYVFRNNSSYLASNFNYSFTKKRFIMLTKEKKTSRAFMKAAIVLPIMGLLAIVLTFSQEAVALNKMESYTEWWLPILKKHSVTEVKAYHNFENVFEMGDESSMKDNVAALTNATMIIKGSSDAYMLIQASHIEHNTESGEIKVKSGMFKCYKMDSDLSQPLSEGKAELLIFNVKSIVESTLAVY